MLSRLQASRTILNPRGLKLVIANTSTTKGNVICKRWSGHNAMNITPSNYGWKLFKDRFHFYFLISSVPLFLIGAYMGIKSNPELTEIPEGYEPREWEYYPHPLTRYMARYFYEPMERDHEAFMGMFEEQSESRILRKIQEKADKVMSFYNDHRSKYFKPHHMAEQIRIQRDGDLYGIHLTGSRQNELYEAAYAPHVNPVPTEGFKPDSID